jgi:hypothetical protein
MLPGQQRQAGERFHGHQTAKQSNKIPPLGANAQTSAAPAAASETPLLKPAELDQLVAPIALYPDSLLAEVLMASAYPLDIVQAERWVQANKNLTGDQLKA